MLAKFAFMNTLACCLCLFTVNAAAQDDEEVDEEKAAYAKAVGAGHEAMLKNEYADVFAYDPEAMPEAKHYLKGITLVDDAYKALRGADALIIVTEWDQFREPDFELMSRLMRKKIIIEF